LLSDPLSGLERWRPWLLLSVLALLVAASDVTARQATPTGRPAATATQQPRPRCPARPASPAALVAVLREPVLADPAAADPRGAPLPPGERAIIGDLVGAWSVCLAAGDVPGVLGLFTPDGVRRLMAERMPFVGGPAGVRITILAVSDVARLEDGRVAARVNVDPSGSGTAPPQTVVVIIEQDDDGAWRIDHLRAATDVAGLEADRPLRALLRRPIAPGPGIPVPPPGPSVSMRGADLARTGIQVGPAPAAEPVERWRAATGWHSDAQPVVARGLAYFGGFSLGERTPILAATDAGTGAVRWQTTAPVAWAEFPDAPALAGDILFAPVQAPVAGVLAVAAATGEPLWFAPFGFTSVTAPATDAASVYVAGWGVRNTRDRIENDAAGAVFALDQRTGRERWRFLAAARVGAVAVGADTVYAPSDRGLFALDRETGHKRWQARFSPGATETATVAGDTVVFAGSEITSGQTGVFALDAASGALRWRVDLPAVAGARAGTAAANDTVFVTWWDAPAADPGNGTPTLRAYDRATGEERWVFRAGDSDGRRPLGSGSVTPPVIVGDVVVFGVAVRIPAPGASGNGDGLYAVATTSGDARWHAAAGEPIRSAPAVLDETIFATGGLRARGGATGGNLFAFGAE
jgi:outer membrane protein assembly factor BamB